MPGMKTQTRAPCGWNAPRAGRQRAAQGARWRVGVIGALALVVSALAACGDDDDSSGSGGSSETVEVAFLNAAQANTYLEATYEAMQAVAERENAEITVFDGDLDAAKQQSQLQNVLASGTYDAIVVAPLNGPALRPLVQQAIDEGIMVGSTNLPLTDDHSTVEPQVDGLSVAAGRPGLDSGRSMGELTVDACAGASECEVAYMYGLKSLPYDLAIREGFDGVLAEEPGIEVVAEGEGEFSAEASLSTMQNLLQANPDIDVLAVAGDQMALGAEKALDSSSETQIVGLGGSIPAIDAIEEGRWFGTAALLPADEGRIAMEGVIEAVHSGTTTGGVDPVAEAGASGDAAITAENASEFEPQWKG